MTSNKPRRFMASYLFCLVISMSACLSAQYPSTYPPSPTLALQASKASGLYLSWKSPKGGPQQLIKNSRLVIQKTGSHERYAVVLDRNNGSLHVALPPGRYQFFSWVVDDLHPLDLRHILPHPFLIEENKLSVIGSLELSPDWESIGIQIHQSPFLMDDLSLQVGQRKIISGYSRQPLDPSLLTSYAYANCEGLSCPHNILRSCLLAEASQGAVVYGKLKLQVKWEGENYSLVQHGIAGYSSYSEQLISCLEEQLSHLTDADLGKEDIWLL